MQPPLETTMRLLPILFAGLLGLGCRASDASLEVFGDLERYAVPQPCPPPPPEPGCNMCWDAAVTGQFDQPWCSGVDSQMYADLWICVCQDYAQYHPLVQGTMCMGDIDPTAPAVLELIHSAQCGALFETCATGVPVP